MYGIRGACKNSGDCYIETLNRVLLSTSWIKKGGRVGNRSDNPLGESVESPTMKSEGVWCSLFRNE